MPRPDSEEGARTRIGEEFSRETLGALDTLVGELRRWQRIKNLVGPRTLDEVWTRHVMDSLQLAAHAPLEGLWLDLGSGAGFPGLVLAIVAREHPGMSVAMVESNGRKCAFLRHVLRAADARAEVHEGRIEDVVPDFAGRARVVTARALAPLDQLLAWTHPLLTTGAVGLFPKGRDAETELTAARRSWTFKAEALPSRTDSEARILRVAEVSEHPKP